MLRLYACVTEQHDLPLVALAGFICFLSCYTAFSLADRANGSRHSARAAGTAATAGVTGGGGWRMHFIGMSALRVPALTSWSPVFVLASLVVGIGGSALAFSLAARVSRPRQR